MTISFRDELFIKPQTVRLIAPETAFHGCYCSGDLAVRMRKVLAAELCCVAHAT